MLDQGGARVNREANQRATDRRFAEMAEAGRADRARVKTANVTVSVTETHDGDGCDCIDKTLVLEVGQELELTHTCHDGRVDKVIAKVVSIDGVPRAPEHGGAQIR